MDYITMSYIRNHLIYCLLFHIFVLAWGFKTQIFGLNKYKTNFIRLPLTLSMIILYFLQNKSPIHIQRIFSPEVIWLSQPWSAKHPPTHTPLYLTSCTGWEQGIPGGMVMKTLIFLIFRDYIPAGMSRSHRVRAGYVTSLYFCSSPTSVLLLCSIIRRKSIC